VKGIFAMTSQTWSSSVTKRSKRHMELVTLYLSLAVLRFMNKIIGSVIIRMA
jgi:hypothetical protein